MRAVVSSSCCLVARFLLFFDWVLGLSSLSEWLNWGAGRSCCLVASTTAHPLSSSSSVVIVFSHLPGPSPASARHTRMYVWTRSAAQRDATRRRGQQHRQPPPRQKQTTWDFLCPVPNGSHTASSCCCCCCCSAAAAAAAAAAAGFVCPRPPPAAAVLPFRPRTTTIPSTMGRLQFPCSVYAAADWPTRPSVLTLLIPRDSSPIVTPPSISLAASVSVSVSVLSSLCHPCPAPSPPPRVRSLPPASSWPPRPGKGEIAHSAPGRGGRAPQPAQHTDAKQNTESPSAPKQFKHQSTPRPKAQPGVTTQSRSVQNNKSTPHPPPPPPPHGPGRGCAPPPPEVKSIATS